MGRHARWLRLHCTGGAVMATCPHTTCRWHRFCLEQQPEAIQACIDSNNVGIPVPHNATDNNSDMVAQDSNYQEWLSMQMTPEEEDLGYTIYHEWLFGK